ncbi:MAG: DUF1553 domain-containing protein [Saprospiraceae bacterium]|nr:DUF1553 domain-containing protein [Saprospiraceae bacterium]
MRYSVFILVIFMAACRSDWSTGVEEALAGVEGELDYNFDIKPILADRCFACHGPDDAARKADLRLDIEEMAKGALEGGGRAIVPRNPGRSLLVHHITTDDPEGIMPPPDSKLLLSDLERAKLIRWIEQGAAYKKHWSFIPPESSEIDEETHPVDYFIGRKLQESNLSPSPPADPTLLVRRVYMDLTGLPPSPQDLDRYLNSTNPDRYEALVDFLLSTSDCAERLSMEWMDVARYADSHGLHADGWRNMWPWRDYVINAFQQNKPYDQFITEQLAGDLLPNASRDQIVATAFHRNHPMTAEGGAIDEEFRLEYVADRTNTTATAILGLTMECAKCHDHKYDPISQEDYYRMSAFFNNVRELGMTGDDGNYGPLLQLASVETQQRIDAIQAAKMELQGQLDEMARTSAGITSPPDLKRGLQVHLPMERVSVRSKGGHHIDGDAKYRSPATPTPVPGQRGKGLKFDEEYDVLFLDGVGLFDVHDPFSTALWINTSKQQPGTTQVLAGNAGDKNNFWRGWDFYLDDQGRLNARLIHALPDNYVHVRSTAQIPVNTWAHVAFTYGGTSTASDLQLYIDGRPADQQVLRNHLTKNIRPIGPGAQLEVDRPLGIAKSYRGFTGENGVFEGIMDEFLVFDRILSPLEVLQLFDPAYPASDKDLAAHHSFVFGREHAINGQIRDLVKQQVAIQDTVAEIMVMRDMEQPRPTHVLNRGLYDQPGKEVDAGTPSSILAFEKSLPKNRLGLAQWLFHPDHPLTARVAVNRYWQMIFGQGLVKSANDFGVQGNLPSHPALLDWLARYFQDSEWDIKNLLKLIVTSETYQQSAQITPEHLEIDPDNILLARSPSYRLPAEMIRDNALAASGLLVKRVGGPSVKPYQPEGLWIDKGTFSHRLLRYEESTGDDLYRRSLYTFVKRTSPHPAMTIFDAPNRDVCTIKREVTNTPLQALVLLNDPQFVEASKALAVRVYEEHPDDVAAQLRLAYTLLTSREASASKEATLHSIYTEQLTQFRADPEHAKQLLKVGAFDPKSEDADQLAALTMVTNTILNTDETYTRR